MTEKYDLEKIKTIGDAYFCVGGLWQASDHPERTLRFAIDAYSVVRDYNTQTFQAKLSEVTNLNIDFMSDHKQIDIRVGINTGSVVAGVIGVKKVRCFTCLKSLVILYHPS